LGEWHRHAADGALVIRVHAQPGASRTEVAGLHGDSLKIRVAAPALEGRANEALVAFIAGKLGIAKREVTLVGGAKSREKRFAIPATADPTRLLPED
jgi:uncharacterized protein (TIGR00251 family)